MSTKPLIIYTLVGNETNDGNAFSTPTLVSHLLAKDSEADQKVVIAMAAQAFKDSTTRDHDLNPPLPGSTLLRVMSVWAASMIEASPLTEAPQLVALFVATPDGRVLQAPLGANTAKSLNAAGIAFPNGRGGAA